MNTTPQAARAVPTPPTRERAAASLWEELPVGRVTCHYLSSEQFQEVVRMWLNSATFHHIVTLNPEMVMAAEHDPTFRQAISVSELRVPDGAGLIWARWFTRSHFWSLMPSLLAFPFVSVERITGVDAIMAIARLCQETGQSVYLVGGTPYQTAQTAAHLTRTYPRLTVHIAPDHVYSLLDCATIIADVNAHRPAAIFVAYGAPRQTVWIERWRPFMPSVRLAMGVGGAFAILSEDRPRAPKLLRQLNLEWLWRLILEPQRLPRIWQATVQFPRHIARQKKLSEGA